jgi:hypothetical protein
MVKRRLSFWKAALTAMALVDSVCKPPTALETTSARPKRLKRTRDARWGLQDSLKSSSDAGVLGWVVLAESMDCCASSDAQHSGSIGGAKSVILAKSNVTDIFYSNW